MANRTQIQTALQKPYDRLLFSKEVLSPVFSSCFTLLDRPVPTSVGMQPNKSEQAVIQSVAIYGNINLEDGTEITCYEITLQPTVRIEHSKVAIQRYVRKLLTAGQIALVNFIAPQNKKVWRLTLVAKDSELTEQGIKEKTTHAKRYTYLLGPSETCKTAAERFETLSTEKQITFQALVNAFSVEKLSKAFFDEYTLHYQKFCDYLQESNFRKSVFKISIAANATKEEKDKACKPIRDFVKKLLGRIVFLYFVQKKGWLGASDTNYKDGLNDFIKKLFTQSGGNDTFYPNWLTVLFFETLNKERSNDDFKMPDGKKIKVPFLNGGLFDKEDYDEAILPIPAKLFHNPDFEDAILTEKNWSNARGFLDFLDAFNFTVHEDSPDDHTVAVDPEMLGHIFENLLEDNKDKGAFYTPKEIVHYMCQESLTEYLATHLSKEYTVYKEIGNAQVELFGNETKTGQLQLMEQLGDKALNRDDVAYIVKHKDISHLTKAQLKKIDALLDTVKICDPAIGSGAFPMGLLQEIHAIKEVLAYELQLPWKPAEVKENIIQNSVYGVDIEKGAVDIARLRFWLSLVVDEEKPRALPNLDYKIVVGDSLVSKFEGEIIEIDWEIEEGTQANMFGNENVLKRQSLLKQITEKQQAYFHATHKQKIAADIRSLKIDILINQLELMINTKGLEKKPTDTGKKAAAQMELWLQTQGWKNTIAKLQKLKQNKDEPFNHFDWKLDFPEVLNPYLVNGNSGFDIVIGNPPYITYKGKEIVDISDAEIKQLIALYPNSAEYKVNSYALFTEKGVNLLTKNGTLSYIIPSTILQNEYLKKIRKYLITKYHITQIVSFANKVFEAVTDSIILFVDNKYSKESECLAIRKNNLDFTFFDDVKTYTISKWNEEQNDYTINLKTTSEEDSLLEIVESNCEYLNDYLEVYVGIVANGIKKFLSERKLDSNHKKYLQGKHIENFELKPESLFINFIKDELHSNTEESVYLQKEKILVRKTGNRLIAVLDMDKYFTDQSIYNLYPKKGKKINLQIITGLLNSKLLEYYFNKKMITNPDVFPYIKGIHLKKLPIKFPKNESDSANFIRCVDYLHHLNKQTPAFQFFYRLLNSMVYEIYLEDILKKSNATVFDKIGTLKEIEENSADKIIERQLNSLSDPSSPLSASFLKMLTIKEINLIEGKK